MKDVVKTGTKAAPRAEGGRRNGREGGIAGYCAVAFVFVSLVVLVLCLTVFFKVKSVEVNGLTLYREDQIMGVGGIVNDENLVRTDTKLIEKRLTENLVFIETAEVVKKYPSTLVINVTEAEKAAYIFEDGKYCAVSKTGRVLEFVNEAQTSGIPVIKGFELATEKPGGELESKDENKLRIYKDMMKIINAIGFDEVREIDLSNRSGITILYDGRITLELGSSVDLDYKLNYFKAVIDNKLADEFKGRLVYNGADSGISAIPEGAGTNKDEPQDQDQSETDKPQDGNNAADPNAAANADTNNNGNANANNDTVPNGVEDYGYMQNEKREQQAANNGNAANNNNGGYDPNNGGYDPNVNTGYDPNANTGYDYNNGGYDPNANAGWDQNGGNAQYYYQP